MSTSCKSALTTLAFVAAMFVATQSASAASPGIRHTVFMAGNVIESSTEGIYLCIGKPEGAEVGQVLDVVRLVRNRSVNPKNGLRFTHKKVGTVRIEAIVDEHFAQATVIEGFAAKRDVVRLSEARIATQD